MDAGPTAQLESALKLSSRCPRRKKCALFISFVQVVLCILSCGSSVSLPPAGAAPTVPARVSDISTQLKALASLVASLEAAGVGVDASRERSALWTSSSFERAPAIASDTANATSLSSVFRAWLACAPSNAACGSHGGAQAGDRPCVCARRRPSCALPPSKPSPSPAVAMST